VKRLDPINVYIYMLKQCCIQCACVCAYIGLRPVAPGTRPPEQYARAPTSMSYYLYNTHIYIGIIKQLQLDNWFAYYIILYYACGGAGVTGAVLPPVVGRERERATHSSPADATPLCYYYIIIIYIIIIAVCERAKT